MEVGKILTQIISYLDSTTAEPINTSYSASGIELNGNKNKMGMEGVEIESSSKDIEHKPLTIERPTYEKAAKEKVTEFDNVRSRNIVHHNTKTERFDKKGKFIGDTIVTQWSSDDKKENYTETTDSNKDGFPVYCLKETKDAKTGKIKTRIEQSDFYMSKQSGIIPAKQVKTSYDSDGNLQTETIVIDPQKRTATRTVVTENPDGTKTTEIFSSEGKDVGFMSINHLDKKTIHDSNGKLISEKDFSQA